MGPRLIPSHQRSASKVAIAGLAFIAGIGLLGCSTGPVEVEQEPTESAPAEVSVETTEAEPTPEPDEPSEGSREKPYPVGASAKWSADSFWTFSVGETNPDAWGDIVAADSYAVPPADGKTYVTAPVNLKSTDDGTGEGYSPYMSIMVDYVTSAGNSYDGEDCYTTLPDPGGLYDTGEMYGDAETDFLACVEIPAGEIAGGTWKFSYNGVENDYVFFVGAP